MQKFPTLNDARRALWLASDDPLLLVRMRRLNGMSRSQRPVQRGVTRLRTIEQAKHDKGAAWQMRPDL